MKKTLRLLITKKCNRHCPGCCNKQWDLDMLPTVTSVCDIIKYKEIILTGGEPLLFARDLITIIGFIRSGQLLSEKAGKILVYTSISDPDNFIHVLKCVDGITLTLHTQRDVIGFKKLDAWMKRHDEKFEKKSLRLNVFKDIRLPRKLYANWIIKKDIVWIKNCPLPKNEEFKRLKVLVR